jgi:antitoxin component YwqK of YwqJK toxin-antitoxin module
MRYSLIALSFLIYVHAASQCKTFRIGSNGDTLNCSDFNGLKQGKWTIHMDPLRGEPGYEEEGGFKNDRKEGIWRRFNLMGDIMAVETYRWGLKNGKSQYFTINGIEREENWRASNPNKSYDTIDVADPMVPNKYEKVIVKVDGTSLKHGVWKYYNPMYGTVTHTEKWVLDNLQGDQPETIVKTIDNPIPDSLAGEPKKDLSKPKPKEVEEFEKKNKGKKQKVRDGKTGTLP